MANIISSSHNQTKYHLFTKFNVDFILNKYKYIVIELVLTQKRIITKTATNYILNNYWIEYTQDLITLDCIRKQEMNKYNLITNKSYKRDCTRIVVLMIMNIAVKEPEPRVHKHSDYSWDIEFPWLEKSSSLWFSILTSTQSQYLP